MSELPDEDQAPLEPPSSLLPIAMSAIAAGREVVALPCVNPALSPTLDVVGMPGMGWYLRVTDGLGTLVWSVMLEGVTADE